MTYWKGIVLAVIIDLVSSLGFPSTVTAPEPVAPLEVVTEWPSLPRADSLLGHIARNPEDVAALEQLASVYLANGLYNSAIGPLARALQIDPSRRSLWVALDRALEKSGRTRITDEELTRRALEHRR